jgi:mevalonate pyrophosphate decarboxylase
MFAPAPPHSFGTAAERSFSFFIASKVSFGKRAFLSTSAACFAATSAAIARVRATNSLVLP